MNYKQEHEELLTIQRAILLLDQAELELIRAHNLLNDLDI
jgi:hypothetical protein